MFVVTFRYGLSHMIIIPPSIQMTKWLQNGNFNANFVHKCVNKSFNKDSNDYPDAFPEYHIQISTNAVP